MKKSMIKKTVVHENERGLLFKNGRFVRRLLPGRYYAVGDSEIETLPVSAPLRSAFCETQTLLRDPQIASETARVDVRDGQRALHYADGRFKELLPVGTHVFWTAAGAHEFRVLDASVPDLPEDFPRDIPADILGSDVCTFVIHAEEVGLLFVNGRFDRLLEAGVHAFWDLPEFRVSVRCSDTQLQQMNISSQELLTADRVTIRVNFVVGWRVTDHVRAALELDNQTELLYTAAQLVLREVVGKYRLDELLEHKEALSGEALELLRKKAESLFAEVTDAGVKDIILPGEVRDIMNTVLVAEKRAQANVITRREEVASTRSLLNTAKMMEENPTLYKLKELEYAERICENVGNINLNGGDLLGGLLAVLGR